MQPSLHQPHFAYQSMANYPTMSHSNLLSKLHSVLGFSNYIANQYVKHTLSESDGHHLTGNSNYAAASSPLSYVANGCSGNRHHHQQQQPVSSSAGGLDTNEAGMSREMSIIAIGTSTASSSADLPGHFPVTNSSSSSSSSSSHYHYHSSWNEAKI